MRKSRLLSMVLLFALAISPSGNADDQNNFRYEIVKKEFRADYSKYKTVTARAVIQGNPTKDNIQDTMSQIVAEIRRQDNPDTIVVYAYKEKEDAQRAVHDFTDFISLARAIWQPKGSGNRLHPLNKQNIQNKESYDISFDIPSQEDIPETTIVTRFDKKTRKNIYYDFDEADYRAFEEAEKESQIGQQLPNGSDAWKALSDPNYQKKVMEYMKAKEKISRELRKNIMDKYQLTPEEVERIENEAALDRWPHTNQGYLYGKEDWDKFSDGTLEEQR